MFKNEKQAQSLSISFGTSGGFTGAKDEFILKENGELTKNSSLKNDTAFIKKLNKKQCADYFGRITSKSLGSIEMNQTGNFNYFIKLMKTDKIEKAYQWTDISDVPQELKTLYNNLMEQTRQNKPDH